NFQKGSNTSLLILKAEQAIEISCDLTVKSVADVKVSNANPKQLEAARRLSIICANLDVISIYRTLGLKSL
ncbi:hypothetical protein AD951_00265, partial [Acetobacter malorum]